MFRARYHGIGAPATSIEGVVAIKVFDEGLLPEQTSALARSLEHLCEAPLDHPSLVPVIAAGVSGGRAWLAEPWFDAVSLATCLSDQGPQPLGEVLLRLTQIAGALDFAGAAGIHHGALHPREILLYDDRTRLAGIGVVDALSEAGLDVPMEGPFVSPQRERGLPATNLDDIYSLAAITYALVYGAPLPRVTDLRRAMTLLTGIDHNRFVEVLQSALSKDPEQRPATALAFAEALQGVLVENTPVTIRPSGAAAVDAGDLPLRPASPPLEVDITEGAPFAGPRVGPEWFSGNSEPESESASRWLAITAGLAIGLLTGFAGGFVAGQRDTTPAPHSAERPLSRSQRAAEAGDKPVPVPGEAFTESTVPPQPVSDEPVIPPPESTGKVSPQSLPASQAEPRDLNVLQPSRTPVAPARPAAGGPTALLVDSRPQGARVFMDGRLVGLTPLALPEVQPGAHVVRIDLSGYRRWVTSVHVAEGTRQRVAASLER